MGNSCFLGQPSSFCAGKIAWCCNSWLTPKVPASFIMSLNFGDKLIEIDKSRVFTFFPIWDKLVWQSSQHTKLLASTLAGPAWRCWELRSVLWLLSSGVSAQCDANVSVACLKRIHASLLQVRSPICSDTCWHSICSWVFQTFYISILLWSKYIWLFQRVSSAAETSTSAGQLAWQRALFLLDSAERTAF